MYKCKTCNTFHSDIHDILNHECVSCKGNSQFESKKTQDGYICYGCNNFTNILHNGVCYNCYKIWIESNNSLSLKDYLDQIKKGY